MSERNLIFSTNTVCYWICFFAGDEKVTISAYIKDSSTGEYLIGATVFEQKFLSEAVTNTYGFYLLTLSKGDCVLDYTYLGYEGSLKRISLD